MFRSVPHVPHSKGEKLKMDNKIIGYLIENHIGMDEIRKVLDMTKVPTLYCRFTDEEQIPSLFHSCVVLKILFDEIMENINNDIFVIGNISDVICDDLTQSLMQKHLKCLKDYKHDLNMCDIQLDWIMTQRKEK